jgi:hypothetical protein
VSAVGLGCRRRIHPVSNARLETDGESAKAKRRMRGVDMGATRHAQSVVRPHGLIFYQFRGLGSAKRVKLGKQAL